MVGVLPVLKSVLLWEIGELAGKALVVVWGFGVLEACLVKMELDALSEGSWLCVDRGSAGFS